MRVAAGLVPDVRKIAVLRPNAIGDFVFALPALHALRHAYPGARISYIGSPWHAGFLAGRPGPVDEVLVLPPCPGIGPTVDGVPDARALEAFVDAQRLAAFDLALQLYGGGRHANPFLLRLGARLTVGMRSRDAAPLDRWLRYESAVNRRLQLLEVAALAGAPAWPMGQELQVTADDHAQAARLVGPMSGGALVLLQPGATDMRRRWPAQRFAALGDALAGRGALVAVNGSASEAALVRAVTGAMRHPAIDLAGRTSLSALCGLLARAALIVSNDTGPLHLALAIGTPAVGIYWLTNLIESAPLRQHGHRAALSLRVHCPQCGALNVSQRCEHNVSFVDDVTLEEVVGLAGGLLDSILAQAEMPATSASGCHGFPPARK